MHTQKKEARKKIHRIFSYFLHMPLNQFGNQNEWAQKGSKEDDNNTADAYKTDSHASQPPIIISTAINEREQENGRKKSSSQSTQQPARNRCIGLFSSSQQQQQRRIILISFDLGKLPSEFRSIYVHQKKNPSVSCALLITIVSIALFKGHFWLRCKRVRH